MMAAPMRSFIFGQGQEYSSPEELAKARALAEAMLGPQRAPQNVGEGLTALGYAIRGRMDMGRINKAEAAGRASAGSALAKALGGQGTFPPAPRSSSGVVDALNPKQTANAAEHERDPSIPGLQIKGGIEETAKSLGIDPVDLATAISYETGGTFDPTKAGPTTKYGRHRGLIQFGEPQAKQYGVDWNNPVGSQLGPDGAVAKYLRDTGVKPGMGMLDIYSAINAGGVGRYGASDAAAGGAPGTVADKVNSQMAGHRAKALAMFGGGQPATPAAAPVQVASLDPSAGMAEAARPMPEEYAKTGLSQEAWARMNAPNGAVPPAQPTVTAALNRQDINPKAAGQPIATDAPTQRVLGQMMQPQSMTGGAPMPIQGQPQQVAQAQPQDLSQIPVMAGGTSGAIDPNQGPDLNTLLEAARNPWLNDQERGLVNTLLEQKMQESDPLRQLQLQKLQQEVNSKPERKTVTINGRLVDAQTGEEIANFEDPNAKAPTVQKLKLDDGSEMAVQWNPKTGKWDPIDAPQGGGGIAPKTKLTENQSKLTLFQSLQTESQPVLIDLEKQFNPANIPDAAARSAPIAGNFFQSEQGQIYEAASTAWAEGALRIATGAAATPEEMERTKKAYFAQPGDTPITIAFKAQMRDMYNRSIERALGKQSEGSLPKPSDFVKQFQKGGASTSGAGSAPPMVIDGYTIEEVE